MSGAGAGNVGALSHGIDSDDEAVGVMPGELGVAFSEKDTVSSLTPEEIYSYLFEAVEEKKLVDPEYFARQLNEFENINTTNKAGETLLTIAASSNNTEAVQILLTKGADTNHLDSKGYGALIYATGNQNLRMIDILARDPDLDIDRLHKDRNTALMTAMMSKKYKAAERLLAAGANPNILNKNAETPLIYCARKKDMLEYASLLIAHGAKINHYGVKRDCPKATVFKTALMNAVQYSTVDMVETLLKAKADPKVKITFWSAKNLLSLREDTENREKIKETIMALLRKYDLNPPAAPECLFLATGPIEEEKEDEGSPAP